MKNARITFFMLVTSKDILIADYAINSYRKINTERLPYKLFIYANCLSKNQKDEYFNKWKKNPHVEIFDNEEKVKHMNIKKHDIIISPEGVERIREEQNENYDELWTTELKKISTDFYATVDADFEILKPDFIYQMIAYLDENKNTMAMSTDYHQTLYNIYESYCESYVNLWERWNTWFCIYKKETHKCNISHFFYREENPNGIPTFYDSASLFQKKMKEIFGWELASLDTKHQNEFIHYAAFSKNLSINRGNISLYRRLRIIRKVGILNFQKLAFLNENINKLSKKVSNRLYKVLFKNVDNERATYN